VDDLERARKLVTIASVQNRYNVSERRSEPVLEICQRDGIGFIPWYPLLSGKLTAEGEIQTGACAARFGAVQLTPARTGTDGFYVCVLEKAG
jgi:aryl-alcohol dehydrogenase-like predicted oxidoreductase